MNKGVYAVAIASIWAFQVPAAEPFERLHQAVTKVLSKQYDDAKLRLDPVFSRQRSFSNNTREFTVYRLDKTGNWQKGHSEKQPDRGGIIVRYYIAKGQWGGALAVPYVGEKDFYVFKESHVIRNSADENWHIWSQISTPRIDPPAAVKRDLVKIFDKFEEYE